MEAEEAWKEVDRLIKEHGSVEAALTALGVAWDQEDESGLDNGS